MPCPSQSSYRSRAPVTRSTAGSKLPTIAVTSSDALKQQIPGSPLQSSGTFLTSSTGKIGCQHFQQLKTVAIHHLAAMAIVSGKRTASKACSEEKVLGGARSLAAEDKSGWSGSPPPCPRCQCLGSLCKECSPCAGFSNSRLHAKSRNH